MTITVLIDNVLSPNNCLETEHGLSLYIETENKKLLCDTGASGNFIANAKAMAIDIFQCDFTFISHGHNDHCGGLCHLFETNPPKNVYMHSNIPYEQYYSSRKGEKRKISCNKTVFEKNKCQIEFIDSTRQISDGIFAIQCNEYVFSRPYGNCFLTKSNGKKEEFDDFRHELSLAFITPKGLVVVSPCSHCGVMNILEECRKVTGCEKIHAFIGGFHFIDSEKCISETEEFTNNIQTHYPDTLFYTGHCTCDISKEILSKRLKNIAFFNTGTIIKI